MMKKIFLITLLVSMLTASCQSEKRVLPVPTSTSTLTLEQTIPTPRYRNSQVTPTETVTLVPTDTATLQVFEPSEDITGTPGTATPASDEWMALPVIPQINKNLNMVYMLGLSLGNDPHAFSIFGDCQSKPEEFFGVFETDPIIFNSLTPELQQTVDYFTGSFNRESPTSQDGTTPGALLWPEWHRGEYGCSTSETPVECELRLHHPSFVLIQIGTHFESRNTEYLRTIINQLLDAGVVPILATKADNRELDNRINRDMALLAAEFDLPLWNFWAAVSDLPNRGLYVMSGREDQGAVYLTPDAVQLHRMSGLAMINAVWRAATGN